MQRNPLLAETTLDLIADRADPEVVLEIEEVAAIAEMTALRPESM